VSAELAPSEYIRLLARARPALEDQLVDIYQVLTGVSDGGNLGEESPLDSARAAYISYLRERHLTCTQVLAHIAAVCACVFVHESAA
jgi:hypothetical protein